jgi:hypothetical protein
MGVITMKESNKIKQNDTLKSMKIPFFQAPNDVFDNYSDLNIYEKVIYLYLCRCSNQGSPAFPSYTTIAEKCSMSRRKAIDSVQGLLQKGYIIKRTRPSEVSAKEHDSNEYELIHKENKGNNGGGAQHALPSAQDAPPVVNDMHHPSAQGAPYKELDYKELSDKDIYSQIQNLYNELCPSLPKAQTLTDKRKKLIKARWKQCNDLDTYRELFIKAEDSDFLSGRDGTWTACNFDWLLNENNMTKVLEGTYRNGQVQKSNPKNRFHNFEQSALNMSKEELKAALHKNDEPFDISQLPADSMARKLALREEVRANKHKWLANNPTYEIDYEAASKSKYGW